MCDVVRFSKTKSLTNSAPGYVKSTILVINRDMHDTRLVARLTGKYTSTYVAGTEAGQATVPSLPLSRAIQRVCVCVWGGGEVLEILRERSERRVYSAAKSS
jgi:hypothetical protein